uniref:Uncharacterized protein n=1 Tax=Anguilla anguilla TaxID=7936 RepID=A0A0E9SAJ8_ANGAN
MFLSSVHTCIYALSFCTVKMSTVSPQYELYCSTQDIGRRLQIPSLVR